MPFQSLAQMRYLFSQHPDIAKRWAKETPNMKSLPNRKEDGGLSEEDYFEDGGIHIKKSNKGKFTQYKKRTGKTTEEALHSQDPHVRKMANFAKNAATWKKQEGGMMEDEDGDYDSLYDDTDNDYEQFQEGGLYNYLNSTGRGASRKYGTDRKALAEQLGIHNYAGTAEQNTRMLAALQQMDQKQQSVGKPSFQQFLNSQPNMTSQALAASYISAADYGDNNNQRRMDKNEQYAQENGMRFNENNGRVTPQFNPDTQGYKLWHGMGDMLGNIMEVASAIDGAGEGAALVKQGFKKVAKKAAKQAVQDAAESRIAVSMPGELAHPRIVPLQSENSVVSVMRPNSPNVIANIAPSEMNYLPKAAGPNIILPQSNRLLNAVPLMKQKGGFVRLTKNR